MSANRLIQWVTKPFRMQFRNYKVELIIIYLLYKAN